MKSSLVSIIIPVKKINDYIRESIPKILENKKYILEIIIFTNELDKNYKWPLTKIIVTGNIGPAEKRDLAIKYARGTILAFIDDDAYPANNWLDKALNHFKNPQIAAVGGPAITPINDSILQKAFGAISESFIGGGKARMRFLSIGKPKFVDDWPTVNLIIRKDIFKKIGGFDSKYWPGEDTKLCLDIISSGYKIIYEPQAIVYHHRRNNLLNYLKQIGNYGLHRGYFVKKYPKTSRRIWYFIPSFFVLYLITLSLLIINKNLILILLIPLSIYIIGIIIDAVIISIRWKNPIIGIIVSPLILLTHIWYGIKFIIGLLIPQLER